jgi:hypothetical protein
VEAAGDDLDLPIVACTPDTIDDTMVPGYPPRPPAGKIASQRLWLADPFERAPPNIL